MVLKDNPYFENLMNSPLTELHFGIILFKIGEIGPQQIYYENIPKELHKNFEQVTSVELGLYLSLVISQGKGMDKEGLFGPLPWYLLPDHELFLFSFLMKDPVSSDRRKKESTLCFLVVLFPRVEEIFNNSRYEIEKALEELIIRKPESRMSISEDTINNIILSTKQIFLGAYESGKKISQERALDEVISFESMELFALYSLQNKTLKSCLIGEISDLPAGNILEKHKNGSSSLISVVEYENGSSSMILEFKELDTIIYIKLNQVIKSHNLIKLLSKIDSSLEILSSYLEEK